MRSWRSILPGASILAAVVLVNLGFAIAFYIEQGALLPDDVNTLSVEMGANRHGKSPITCYAMTVLDEGYPINFTQEPFTSSSACFVGRHRDKGHNMLQDRDRIMYFIQNYFFSYTRNCASWMYKTSETAATFITSVFSTIVSIYFILLSSNPLFIKAATAALVGGLGDFVSQEVELRALKRREQKQRFDYQRAFSIAAEGLFISGPLMHYVYGWLEKLFPIDAEGGLDSPWTAATVHVTIDCVIFDAFFVTTLMVASAILEGRRRHVPNELRTELWPAIKVSWCTSIIFSPIQCLLFRYLPLNLRVLAMNVQDVIWNAAMSYMAHRSRN